MMTDQELLTLTRELAPIIGKNAGLLWQKYLLARTPERKEAARRRIKLIAEHHLHKGEERATLPPPSAVQTQGEILLATVEYPESLPYGSFGLKREELARHTLIFGMTGAGKTTATHHILRQLARKEIPWLVFDWQKEYKKLKKEQELAGTFVMTTGKSGTLRFNPLCPPKGTDPLEWLTKLTDVINHAYLGGHGTEFILRNAIHKAYEHTKTLQGEENYPTFRLVYQYIKKNYFKGRQEMWNQSATRILESLTYQGGLGPALNDSEKTNLKALFKRNTIIELDTLSNNDKTFLTEALLLWLYEYRKNQGETDQLRHVLVIEEAHNILSKAKEKKNGGETIMETTLRMIRKFGQAVIAIDQEPSKVSESIKANTTTKIAFTLGNGTDIKDTARTMELSPDQRIALDHLQVGQAIAKVKGRINNPILIRFSPPPKKETHSGEVFLGSETR